jgi:hypothetical protein
MLCKFKFTFVVQHRQSFTKSTHFVFVRRHFSLKVRQLLNEVHDIPLNGGTGQFLVIFSTIYVYFFNLYVFTVFG